MSNLQWQVIGCVLYADPIGLASNGCPLNWTVIQLYTKLFNWDSFKGNKAFIGMSFILSCSAPLGSSSRLMIYYYYCCVGGKFKVYEYCKLMFPNTQTMQATSTHRKGSSRFMVYCQRANPPASATWCSWQQQDVSNQK